MEWEKKNVHRNVASANTKSTHQHKKCNWRGRRNAGIGLLKHHEVKWARKNERRSWSQQSPGCGMREEEREPKFSLRKHQE
ncbi:uncharacterized protein LOC135370388 isoform X2 [Ornithodoros turicata]